ncbi:MAG TPA: hypothetical protein VFD70_30895 [Anaerolineae bacterium]|nr:hypothetical protein [Anaerolineae bacterium]
MAKKNLSVPALPKLPSVERELQFDEWAATMKDLFEFQNKLEGARVKYQLIVGRAFAYGQERWKRGAEHEVTRIGYAIGTLYNWSSVAKRISPALERDFLTFEDYRALAKLEDDTEREKWIALKQANSWSGKRLDAEILKSRQLNAGGGNGTEPREEQPSHIFESQHILDFADPTPDAPHLALGRTADQGRKGRTALEQLYAEWLETGEMLQGRGDEMSRAQADVYFDCAATLRQTIGG